MFHCQRSIATNATAQITSANRSTRPVAGKMTGKPNQTARFKITPTTAAVTVERADVSDSFPRNFSTYGAPRKIQRKHGTKVVHVVMSAPSVAARSGGR